jgi:filamentous hemagglutinin family protein
MNKKLNPNFSLKKLLLSALVAGPLAILPAPLWALPSTAATNLTTSSTSITYSGVLDGVAAGALNITAPDKSILTWQAFNINAADTINYLLPSTTASVLNNVAGGAASTIAGAINSNGNVYLLNPAGIVISQTAAINTGGFYASTVAEPSSFFTTTGTLNFTGSATTDVVVQSDGQVTAGQVASIQALGTGNKITLAGRSVLVEGANLFGNVTLQSAATGKVNLAQTSNSTALLPDGVTPNPAYRQFAGGAVNILPAAGSGGNLTIVSNGGSVSLTGAPVAVSNLSDTAAGPAVSVNTTGGLVVGAGGLGGSGYAPSSNIALSITAPLIRQSLNSTTTASTSVGTTAVGFATTNAQGQITGYSLTTNGAPSIGSGYISNVTSTVIGNNVTITVPQAGFATNVAGALSVNTTGSTANGAVTQGAGTSTSRLTVTGAATITTATTATTAAAADVTLGNAALSTLNLPLVGTVNVIESDGFALGNAKVLPNTANAVTLRAQAGNISMSGTSKVEIVPSVLVPAPNTLLTTNTGGVTYSNIGDLKITTLSTTTSSSGVTALTSTGNVTIPNFASPSLTITTTGGTITTGTLTSSSGAANQVSATLTANGNISVSTVNTSGKIVINSGGTITLGQAANGFMTTGAGLDLKAVGDITMTNATALVTSGTDAKIASTTGNVTLTGGFAGGGAITAANNITIGAPGTGKATAAGNISLDGTPILWKLVNSTISNPGGLYTPSSSIPFTVSTNGSGPVSAATGTFTTNAAGQVTAAVITDVGVGYGPSSGAAPTLTLTATNAPTNSVVANSALTLTATAGTVAVASPIVGTGAVTIVSGGALTVPSITATNVSLESTTGSIAQTAATAITASGNTTLKAATSVSLDLAGNDFNNVVLTSSPSGVTLKDANALVLANGTNAAGNVTITSGAGLTGFTAAAITVPNPTVPATFGATTVSAGSVTSVALTTTGIGYAANATIPVTFTAPPAKTLSTDVLVNAASTGQSVKGFVLGAVGATPAALQAVILPSPIGNGFVSGSEVPLTIVSTNTTPPTAVGVVNANGQIASVKITNPGAGVTAIASISTAADAPILSATATGALVTNAAGQVTSLSVTDGGSGYLGSFAPRVTAPAPATGAAATITPVLAAGAITSATSTAGAGFITAPVIAATATAPAFTTTIVNGAIATVTPIATGGVALGSASTDVIKVAGNLTLSSVGPVGTATTAGSTVTANYSELTTVSANVAVVGNVSLNTLGANATFGVPTGGFGAAPAVSAAAVGGAIGTGTFTVTQNNSVNLGATTAGVLKAKSAAGDITNSGKLAIAGASEFTAGSLFAPAVITLNDATNVFGGTVSIINGKNVSVVGATAVTVGSAAQNGVVSGSISVESAGALNLGVAGNGNLSVVSFKAAGAVVISDGLTNTDGLTLQNISNTGTGTVGVTAAGPITLGSGIKLASTGTTTITSTGTAASIKDSAPGISIINGLTLNSDNDIAITNTGHSIGRVTMTSGLGLAASTNASITYQEGGSANLGAVEIKPGATTPGSLSVTSTGGSIFQGAGTITVPTIAGGTNTVSFSAPNGSVTLASLLGASLANNIAPAVSLTASGDSTVSQTTAQNLILGNVAVTAGKFTATLTNGTSELAQAAGTTVRAFGDTTLTTNAGKITLDNVGNNFGGLTIASNANVPLNVGAAVVLREGGTINLKAVDTGTAVTSTLKLTSDGGSIVSSSTALLAKAIKAGGPTTLVSAADVTLNTTDVTNNFGGQSITITAPGNVSIQDSNATTVIAGGSTIGGTMTVKNDFVTVTVGGVTTSGLIKDSPGELTVNGNVFLQTSATGSINIGASTAKLGAIQFRSGGVSIAEATTLNLAAGSTSAANSVVQLSSNGDIVTSGLGGGSFGGTLSLNANGSITVSNPIFVAQGLTFRALGAVNLSALSQTGNLSGLAPTNLGAASYVAPSP